MDRIVIATHNAKKAGEMTAILGARFPRIAFVTLADFPGAPEPEETGDTYRENAQIKALSAARFTGLPSLADDAGLEIDALGGAPGVHSKRFEGAETGFADKMAKVLDLMADVPEAARTARFRCWIAFAEPKGTSVECTTFEAVCEGRIARLPAGLGGFGYDPIFFLPEQNCTMAELSAEQKHDVSHRGKVLREFSEWLGRRLGK